MDQLVIILQPLVRDHGLAAVLRALDLVCGARGLDLGGLKQGTWDHMGQKLEYLAEWAEEDPYLASWGDATADEGGQS